MVMYPVVRYPPDTTETVNCAPHDLMLNVVGGVEPPTTSVTSFETPLVPHEFRARRRT
jgi:hypothetical protein